MLAWVSMAATNSPPTEHTGHGWKTFGITLGLIVLAAACLIPLGVSVIFWGPLAVVVAVGMWIGAARRRRIPADAYRRDEDEKFRPPHPPGGGWGPPAASP
jgi:hypothetical protein